MKRLPIRISHTDHSLPTRWTAVIVWDFDENEWCEEIDVYCDRLASYDRVRNYVENLVSTDYRPGGEIHSIQETTGLMLF